MSYRLTAERLGDTVLVTVTDPARDVVFTMSAEQAVQFGWDLLALGAADSPALTAEAITTGRGL